jgi:signal transduction histidine kinase
MTMPISPSTHEYAVTLTDYCSSRGEADLYQASLLGQRFVESGIGPDDIVALHTEALEQVIANLPLRQKAGAAVDALQFLLEVMIAYGVHHREYLELRLGERTRAAEAQALLDRQHAQQAQQADEEKTALLSVIVHELRTPITAVRGYIDLALRGFGRNDSTNAVEMLTAALDALRRLTRLSDELGEVSRGEPPQWEMTPELIRPILVQALTWARPAAEAKQIALVDACPESELCVDGNADALLSVFSNLLSNAIRYTPPGGTVTLHCVVSATEVAIAVTDTGIGMTPEVRAHIFEKFYRSPEAQAWEASGLGLGLALTQQRVLAHGGRIEVESQPGAGSTFRVLLPLSTEKDKEDKDGHPATIRRDRT